MKEWFTIDTIEHIIQQYQMLGPLFSMLLTAVEAFIPFIPLVVIVIANVNAFGFLFGFLISWAGSSIGAYLLFLVVRKFGKHPKFQKYIQRQRVQKLIKWVDMNGFTPLLILLCFPFTPAIIVNIVAGLSNLRKQYYLIAILVGKLIMILTMSGLGYDIRALLTDPIKLVLVTIVLVILWFAGKQMENRLNKKVERDLRALEKEKGVSRK
ncbi:TVP38/TMEM64 family protein [Solibacillus sp. CAU 1738]|uniref:TVP38/TMEM64 family protein n=1 Tax=Solibacillus sp. CAU 1738 TaxID=3140363 RepID=UPI0032615D83